LPEETAFTAQRRHQPVLIGIPRYWLQRIESNDLSRGYEPRELPMLHASKGARLFNSLACRHYIRGRQRLAEA